MKTLHESLWKHPFLLHVDCILVLLLFPQAYKNSLYEYLALGAAIPSLLCLALNFLLPFGQNERIKLMIPSVSLFAFYAVAAGKASPGHPVIQATCTGFALFSMVLAAMYGFKKEEIKTR